MTTDTTRTMTSRERVLTALDHREPDHVPLDLSGTHVTAISAVAYANLREHLGLEPREPIWIDVIQQAVMPHADVLERLEVDTRGLFPLCSHNWDVMEKAVDEGERWVYTDEWGITHAMPRHGHWFSMIAEPLADAPGDPAVVDTHAWPDPADPRRVAGLREQALAHRRAGKVVMVKSLCAGLFEMHQRLRGMPNAMMDPLMYPELSDRLIGKLTDLKLACWEMVLGEMADVVDIMVETDDYGTQQSQLISPDQYRQFIQPHQKRLFAEMKRMAGPEVKLFLHSCGNVRPLLPAFIDMGVDILNPIHIAAAGMEPGPLKRDFGDAITFWGGGVETQGILPTGTPEQVREDVRRNLDALAPGGGYVFNTVHNIQGEVPPENIMAMWDAWKDFGHYQGGQPD